MAYGPRSKRVGYGGIARRTSAVKTIQAAARKRAFTKARGGLKKVSRIQRQPYAPRIVKNTASIATLSRAVSRLQRQQIGAAQKRISFFQFQPTAQNDLSLDRGTPIAFCMENIYFNAPIYQATNVGSGITTLGNFQAQGVFSAGSPHDMWQGANEDTVSTERFLPTYVEFLIEFYVTMNASDETQTVRIDLVKPNKILQKTTTTGGHNLTMPDGLPAFKRLAEENVAYQTAINPEYFRKIQRTKYLKFKNMHSNTASRVIRKFVKIKMKFPNMVLDPDIHTNQAFITQMDARKLSWLVVNHSENTLTDVNFRMGFNVRRICYWRDQHGVAS